MRWLSCLDDGPTRDAWLAGPRLDGLIARASAALLAARGGALRAHGLTHVLAELHGPSAPSHAVTVRSAFDGTPPSFDEVLAALTHARTVGLAPVVLTRVGRSNARVLRELGALVTRLGAVRWILLLPWHPPALAPPQLTRAALTLPFALDAAQRTTAAGTPSVLVGAPLCLVGPLTSLAHPGRGAEGRPCDGCAARPGCAGLGAAYSSLFGHGELRALPAMPALAADPLTELVLGGLPSA
jgi:hypothetical protein